MTSNWELSEWHQEDSREEWNLETRTEQWTVFFSLGTLDKVNICSTKYFSVLLFDKGKLHEFNLRILESLSIFIFVLFQKFSQPNKVLANKYCPVRHRQCN